MQANTDTWIECLGDLDRYRMAIGSKGRDRNALIQNRVAGSIRANSFVNRMR